MAGRWFSPVYSTNKTGPHDITEKLLKVALNTITLIHLRLHTLQSETKAHRVMTTENVTVNVKLSHLTLLTFTDYFPHIIKKKYYWMLKLTAIGKNILLLNYTVFKTIVHVLVLFLNF